MSATVQAGYKQTEVGAIPKEWEVDRLDKFWSVADCKHVTAQFVPSGYPLASIREVQSRFVDLSEAKQTTLAFYNLMIDGGRKPESGDLIISRNATVGEVAQVSDWHPPFAMGQDVCLLRKRKSEYSSDYLQSLFKSRVIVGQILDAMVGSTFKRINVKQIKAFVVPIPSVDEQRAIATALSDVDALLAKLDALVTKKRDLKVAAVQQLLTGKTRLPGFSGEWEVKRLGDVLQEIGDGATPSTTNASNFGGSVAWVVIDDIRDEIRSTRSTLTEQGLSSCAAKLWPVGTLILSTGATIGEVGITQIPVATKQGICGLLFKAELATSLYMKYWFQLNKAVLLSKAQGSSIKEVRAPTLIQFQVNLPLKVEQTAIATVLSDMDAELATLEVRRDKTRAIKQGMMQELLTGRIRLV